MTEQGRNLIIGVFVIAAICISVWIILFLHPTVGDQDRVLKVRFANIEKINLGTKVTFAGRSIGKVVEISQIYDARDQPATASGAIYFYQLILAIDSKVKVYNTDTITVRTTGLFGERDIAILPQKPPSGVKPVLITNEVLYAYGTDQMEEAFSQFAEIGSKLDEAVEKISDFFGQNDKPFADALAAVRNAADGFGKTMQTVEDEKLVKSFREAADNLGLFMISMKTDIDKLDEKQFFENLGDSSANLKSFTNDLAKGKGTIGRLVNDDDVYLKLMSLMGKGETLMNDINHYGLMFSMDRGWKRERARRMNLMNQLQSPRAFRDYFSCELDRINTALARVSDLIARAECECPNAELLENPCFADEFANLLREVQSLQGELKRYNERLVSCEHAKCEY